MAWHETTCCALGFVLFLGVALAQTCSSNTKPVFTVALIGGPRATEGRLELYYNGRWGTVCSEGFTDAEAKAACQTMGFYGGYVMQCFQEASLRLQNNDPKPIWLSNVNCSGKWWFHDCSFSPFGQTDCDHSQDVFIRCMPTYRCTESPELTACEAKHKSKTLTTTKVRKLANLSDRSDFYNFLLAPLLRVRDVGSSGHTAARQHIVHFMRGLKWHVEEDEFVDDTPLGRKTFTNIIATRNLNAPRRLVFACHYDSKYFTRFQFIGMTDSAVPCAMLLDLGKTLNESIWKPRNAKGLEISLQFIFFDGEEAFVSWTRSDSIYGARHLAEKWEQERVQVSREMAPITQNQRIDAFVLLDLIGYKNPTFKNWFSQTSHLFERLKKIELRLAREGLLERDNNLGITNSEYFNGGLMQNLGIEDDHVPFRDRGVPVLHLIAYPFPPVWHRQDDHSRNFDPVSVDNLLKIFRVLIAEYLNLDP